MTELKRRILSIRQRAFVHIRAAYPAQSIRWCRFQAKIWTEMEIKRKKDELHKKAVTSLKVSEASAPDLRVNQGENNE